jgi:hypothetical protein
MNRSHVEEQWNLQFTPKNTLYLYQKQQMLKEKCIWISTKVIKWNVVMSWIKVKKLHIVCQFNINHNIINN